MTGKYWTSRGIAKAIQPHLSESSVWKVTSRFRECGALEDQPPVRVPVSKRVVKDAWGHPIGRTTKRIYRAEVPCRLSGQGRRLAELMGFARQQRIFSLEPQKERITENEALLAKFKQAGFSEGEVEAAVKCGLIYEAPTKSYTPMEGFKVVSPGTIVSALVGASQERQVEYRYKYKAM